MSEKLFAHAAMENEMKRQLDLARLGAAGRRT
jgi:hypothetical protein